MRTKSAYALMAAGTVIALIMVQITYAQKPWLLNGNSNAATTSKLGTTNGVPLKLYTNDKVRVTITANGSVGIGAVSSDYKLYVNNTADNGIYGSGSGYGVYGNGSYGVYGSGTSYGVYGYSSSNYGVLGSSGYTGVYGSGTTYGVYGYSSGNYGVYGYSGYMGVYGSGTSYGVYGYSSSNYGVYGSSGYIGVYGSGTNYGLYGYSSAGYGARGSSSTGYGGYFSSSSSYSLVASSTSAAYSGVFYGAVYSSGGFVTSDKRMKKNIKDFSNAMDIINELQPKNYEYLTDGKYASLNLPKGTHYGLIAQDLEQVLPNLVKEAPQELRISSASQTESSVKPVKDDGNSSGAKVSAQPSAVAAATKDQVETINIKAVNYEELIPIMIKAMQEQQKEINELKEALKSAGNTQSISSVSSSETTNAASKTETDALLKQNAPNPFAKNTNIQFALPANATQGQLMVYNMNGTLVKSFTVTKGQNQVTFDKGALTSGNYMYALIVDGKKIDSKTMTLTK